MSKTIDIKIDGWKAMVFVSIFVYGAINLVVSAVVLGTMLYSKAPSIWDSIPKVPNVI